MEGIIWLGFIVLSFIFYVKILNKAGYSGWYSLLVIIPLVGFIMMWVFAFLKWPVIREAEEQKRAEEDVFVEK
jgi:uncharacterized membrane protein YhaH (DUF805 family)